MTPAACLSPDAFTFDPAKLRPQRLKLVIREAAKQYEQECAFEDRRLGRLAYRRLFVTLTYKENTRGNKRDISECIKRMRHWAARCGARIRYVWVAEVQKRGALHYHLLLWLPKHLHLPKLDKRGWWSHGMTNIQTARNPVGYLVKYASKCRAEDLKRFRKGTRLYGNGGGWSAWREHLREKLRAHWITKLRQAEADAHWQARIDEEIAQQERAEADTLHTLWPDEYPPPEELDDEAESIEHHLRQLYEQARCDQRDVLLRSGRALLARCLGGHVDRVTGQFYESPYVVTVEHGVVIVQRKENRYAK